MEQSLGVSIPAVAEAGVNVSVSYGGEITLSVGFRATSICPSDTSGWHLESVQGSASNPVSPIIASAPIPPSEMAVTYFRDGNSVWVYSHRLNKRFPLPWG
jgi:hypothetical protein